MGVSKNNGTPKSSILIGFSIILSIHFGGFTPIFGNIHIRYKNGELENGDSFAASVARCLDHH